MAALVDADVDGASVVVGSAVPELEQAAQSTITAIPNAATGAILLVADLVIMGSSEAHRRPSCGHGPPPGISRSSADGLGPARCGPLHRGRGTRPGIVGSGLLLAGEHGHPEQGDDQPDHGRDQPPVSPGQGLVEDDDAEQGAGEQGHGIARRHGRSQHPGLERRLLQGETQQGGDDQGVGGPGGEDRSETLVEEADEHLGHRGLEGERTPGGQPEQQRLPPAGPAPTQAHEYSDGCGHQQAGGPPGCGRWVGCPGTRLGNRDEGHDPDHDGQGAGDLAPADPLPGEAHADGEGEDEAEGADRLHDDQRTPIEGRGLQDPPRGLEESPDQPDRSAQDLDQKPGIVGAPGGLQGPLLLEHRAHREAHRGQKGHDLGHPSLLPLGEVGTIIPATGGRERMDFRRRMSTGTEPRRAGTRRAVWWGSSSPVRIGHARRARPTD